MRRCHLAVLMVIVLCAVLIGTLPSLAATGGSITIDAYAPGWIMFTFSGTGVVDETGNNNDHIGMLILDGNCEFVTAVPWTFQVYTPLAPESITNSMPLPPVAAEPVTMELWDVPDWPGLALQEYYLWVLANGAFMDSDSTDPDFPGCTQRAGISPGPGKPFDPGDDRLNREAWATAALYCLDDGSLQAYGIDVDAHGYFVFGVSSEIMAADPPAENTVIASGEGLYGQISLWRLASGEFQLHAPGLPPETAKPYDFIFNGC